MASVQHKLRVGGVPEHFNSPFNCGLREGYFADENVALEFVNCPGGTGEMVGKLRDGRLDVAVALTEGLVASIARGAEEFKIIGTFTDSPLTWTVSVGAAAKQRSVDDLEGGVVGISRFGSGSHIMAIVMAKLRGWKRKNEFTVLKDFKGLRDGVNHKAASAKAGAADQQDGSGSSGDEAAGADCFLWEEFTTKPYYDQGEVRRIPESITTPWPAFMIAARVDVLEREPETVLAFLRALRRSCAAFTQDKGAAVQYVVDHYGNLPEDAATWFDRLRYSPDNAVSRKVLSECALTLVEADVLAPELVRDDELEARLTHGAVTKLSV